MRDGYTYTREIPVASLLQSIRLTSTYAIGSGIFMRWLPYARQGLPDAYSAARRRLSWLGVRPGDPLWQAHEHWADWFMVWPKRRTAFALERQDYNHGFSLLEKRMIDGV